MCTRAEKPQRHRDALWCACHGGDPPRIAGSTRNDDEFANIRCQDPSLIPGDGHTADRFEYRRCEICRWVVAQHWQMVLDHNVTGECPAWCAHYDRRFPTGPICRWGYRPHSALVEVHRPRDHSGEKGGQFMLGSTAHFVPLVLLEVPDSLAVEQVGVR